MNTLRFHWFDIGLGFALLTGIFLAFVPLNPLAFLLWLSLISLFLHQAEEYRYPGFFPSMMNSVMFGSQQPDHYPLNTNTALIINVLVGWLTYFLAAIFAEKAVWLGIATLLISAGNFIAHTFLFNIKGKTRYNPGMLTALLLFLPIAVIFFGLIIHEGLATPLDWTIGIPLGIVLNYLGILKLIDWLKDMNTPYIFPQRFMRSETRRD
jgi:hypothetical protein